MSWIYILGIAVALVVMLVLFRATPPKTKPIAGTQLMTVGRYVLGFVAAVLVFAAIKAATT